MNADQQKNYEEAAKEYTLTHFSFHSSISAIQGESFFMGAIHGHNEAIDKAIIELSKSVAFGYLEERFDMIKGELQKLKL